MAKHKKLRELFEAGDLNLLPIMNLICLLIPFLLLAAQFVKVGVIMVETPHRSRVPGKPPPKQPLNLALIITDQGFYLKSKNGPECPAGMNQDAKLCFRRTEGKLDMYMYILVMGRVELKSQNKVIGEMEAGATFGEIGLMGEKRTADVIAASPSLLLEFSAENLNRLPLTIQAIFLRRVLLDVMGRLQNVNMKTYLSVRTPRYIHAAKNEEPDSE